MDRKTAIQIVAIEDEASGPIPFALWMRTIWLAVFNPSRLYRVTIRCTKKSIIRRLEREE